MPQAFYLRQGDAGAILSLQAAEGAGWRLERKGWIPVVAPALFNRLSPPVTETIRLFVHADSHDALATDMQDVAAFQAMAHYYISDQTAVTPIWLHAKMDGETSERRALVRRIDVIPATAELDECDEPGVSRMDVMLKVEREPWERPVARNFPGVAPAAAASVVYDYTAAPGADIVGDIPARIARLRITSFAAPPDFGYIWGGLRSANKHGTLANFVPVWECEDGVNVTDASDVGDATASGGIKVRVTPGTATWAHRMWINLSRVTANYLDNCGTFLWLLRAQVTAGEWEVQLRSLGANDGPIVKVANSTGWAFHEMGVFTLPLVDLRTNPTIISGAGFEIWARRTSGAGSLDMDCLCPVPVDEGFISSSEFVAETPGFWDLAVAPTGQVVALSYRIATGFIDPAGLSFENFYLPVGDGRLIIVYQRSSGLSVITDRIVISNTSTYFERWNCLRGTE